MMKRLIALALAATMLICAAVVGTVAYLTDTDHDVNVMVMGNVKINQFEMERVKENGAWVSASEPDKYGYTPDKLQSFTQGQRLLPAIYMDGNVKWDDRAIAAGTPASYHMQSWGEVGASGANQLFDDSVKNVLDKFVFVENTGNEDLYYRTWVAIECPEGVDSDLIHTNSCMAPFFDLENVGTATIDGVRYIISCYTYTSLLAPEAVSRPSLMQIYLDPKTTDEDVQLFEESLDVLVLSQAVQAEGWEDKDLGSEVIPAYEFALDSAFGDVAIENQPWVEGWDVWSGEVDTSWYKPGQTSYVIRTPEQLAGVAALVNSATESFKGVTLTISKDFDLGGKQWTPIGDGDRHFEGILDGNGKTIRNLKVTGAAGAKLGDGQHCVAFVGSMRAGAVIKDLTFDGAKTEIEGYAGYVAVVAGHVYNRSVVENCHVLNAKIVGADKVGAIVGFAGNDTSVTIKNCSAKNVSIIADRQAGVLIGYTSTRCVIEGNTFDAATCSVTWSGANYADSDASTVKNEAIGELRVYSN